jgi:hypothetical protein
MASSGTTAKQTTDANPITLIAATDQHVFRHLTIINEGNAAGFFSFDGGTEWHRLPVGSVTMDNLSIMNLAVQAKRDGANDLTGIYASTW